MKYIKYFEAAKETANDRMLEYADDIVKVLVKYYSTHTGDLCDKIDDIVWNSSAGDEFEETDRELTEEIVRTVISDLEGDWERNIENLLDVYYDCRKYVKNINEDDLESIKEIFAEYSDSGKINISKTSRLSDDRYSVVITMKDVFFNINFEEVFGRIKDLGFENYHVDGIKNGYVESMTIEFWKKLEGDED